MALEHGSSASGDLLNILEFIPLQNRGNNQYDCYDSLSGCIIRLTLPMIVDEPRYVENEKNIKK